MGLLDPVPEGFEQLRAGAGRRDTVGVRAHVRMQRLAGESDAELARGRAHLLEERSLRWGRPVGIARHGAGHGIQDRRGVPQRPRHHVLDDGAGPVVADVGAERGAPARGLEPDETAFAGGDANGASAVVGVCGRHDARRHGGGRAAARSPGRVVEIPRIVGRAVDLGLGRGKGAELGHVGLPQEHEASRSELRRQMGIVVRDPAELLQEARSRMMGITPGLEEQVFEQQRHAAERAVGKLRRGGLGARFLVERRDHGVELWIQALGPFDRGLHELARLNVAATHELRLSRCVERRELVRHPDLPPASARRFSRRNDP